jgi:hypothetical protein
MVIWRFAMRSKAYTEHLEVNSAGEGEDVECTPELAEATECVADCLDLATCDAISGADHDGAWAFIDCVSLCQ